MISGGGGLLENCSINTVCLGHLEITQPKWQIIICQDLLPTVHLKKKWCTFADTTSAPVLLCHYEWSSRRHNCIFGNVYMRAKPVLFRRSLSLRSNSRKLSDLQPSCTPQMHVRI